PAPRTKIRMAWGKLYHRSGRTPCGAKAAFRGYNGPKNVYWRCPNKPKPSVILMGSEKKPKAKARKRGGPMQYLLMIYADESGWNKMSKAEQEQGMAAYMAYTEALKKAGVWQGSNRLKPVATATTVKNSANGKPQVQDGPFADSKEQLGGYYLIEVA